MCNVAMHEDRNSKIDTEKDRGDYQAMSRNENKTIRQDRDCWRVV
jgi:hypothetical protein